MAGKERQPTKQPAGMEPNPGAGEADGTVAGNQQKQLSGAEIRRSEASSKEAAQHPR